MYGFLEWTRWRKDETKRRSEGMVTPYGFKDRLQTQANSILKNLTQRLNPDHD